MKLKKKERVEYILTLKEDEFDAVLNLIECTSIPERTRMGLTQEHAELLNILYKYIEENL